MVKKSTKVQIFVCTHKPVEGILNDSVYTPLFLGHVFRSSGESLDDYIGDDTGDNISERGAHYSEGTGMYWIWKNVHDCKYVGVAQYRRRFKDIFTEGNIESYFDDGTDVLLSQDYFRRDSRYYTALTYMQMEDFLILKSVIKKLYPDYYSSFISYLHDFVDHPFNLIVCRKDIYDKYCEWAFGICFEMEKHIRYSSYTNSKRVFGYVLELLTPIFFLHNGYKIKTMPVLVNDQPLIMPFRRRLLMFVFHNCIWRLTRKKEFGLDLSFIRGLEQDGIDLDFS